MAGPAGCVSRGAPKAALDQGLAVARGFAPRTVAMANPLDRFGGVGGIIRKAVPYVATYLFGKKMGERGTRKQAEEAHLRAGIQT